MSRPIVFILFVKLMIACFANLGCTNQSQYIAKQSEMIELDFNRSNGNLTLNAKRASLFTILKQLKDKYQIDVIVPNLNTDQVINGDFVNMPLNDALALLLPPPTRFYFRAKDARLTIPGKTGMKEERKQKQVLLAFPIKDQKISITSKQTKHLKRSPEKVRLIETTGGRGKKLPPYRLKIISGEGPKKTKEREPEGKKYARLNLYFDKKGVQLVRFLEVEGKLIQSTAIHGPFFYVAYIGDSIFALGSMEDPFVIRSYREDFGHSEMRADEAYILVSLPPDFLDQEVLSLTVIRFFFFEEKPQMKHLKVKLPKELNSKTFMRFKPFLRLVGKIAGDKILDAYQKRNQNEKK